MTETMKIPFLSTSEIKPRTSACFRSHSRKQLYCLWAGLLTCDDKEPSDEVELSDKEEPSGTKLERRKIPGCIYSIEKYQVVCHVLGHIAEIRITVCGQECSPLTKKNFGETNAKRIEILGHRIAERRSRISVLFQVIQ